MRFYTVNGEQIRTERIGNGLGQLLIDGGSLNAGTYVYTLVIDGKQVDSKIMVLTR